MPWQWPWRRHDRALWQVGDLVVPATAAGVAVTSDSALRLSTVFGCVRLLADSVSTLPLAVYRGDDRDPIPTPPLLQRPSGDHPELSDWLWAAMASLLLRGNCWGLISDRAGPGLLPAQVDLLDPDRVTVDTASDPGRTIIRIGADTYERSEVWHIKAYPRAGSIEGMSPIAYARESIALGIAAERYGARFFGDAAIPTGYLHSEQPIKDDTVKRMKAEWENAHHGRRGTAVLAGVKYQPLSLAPDESQFLGTQRANVATICRIFGIAPEQMGGETAGHEAYTSPEQRSLDFLSYSLRPWLHRLERSISTLLPSTQTAKFNAGAFLRATTKERYEAHEIGIRAGFLTRDEVRDLEDRPPLPEGGAIA
jgi:HK97 family phage portal protein